MNLHSVHDLSLAPRAVTLIIHDKAVIIAFTHSGTKKGDNGNLGNQTEIAKSYDVLAERFVGWTRSRSDIRAALLIGSRVRNDRPADEWADLDVVVITTNAEYYVLTEDWVREMGKPLLTLVEPTATGDEKERRVLYEGMLDVDFAILPLEKARQMLRGAESSQTAAQLANSLGRGVRVLIDKDNMLPDLKEIKPPSAKASAEKPTEGEFLNVVNDFLYHTIWTAKHLLRGELWWADLACNCRLSQLMLRMIEWHAQAEHDWKYDTWFRGRFLEEWADQQILEELKTTFTHYDKQDTSKTLMATLNMFHRIAKETADKQGYHYPQEAFKSIREWLQTRL